VEDEAFGNDYLSISKNPFSQLLHLVNECVLGMQRLQMKAVFNELQFVSFRRAEEAVPDDVSVGFHFQMIFTFNSARAFVDTLKSNTGVVCQTRFKAVSLQETVCHIKQKLQFEISRDPPDVSEEEEKPGDISAPNRRCTVRQMN